MNKSHDRILITRPKIKINGLWLDAAVPNFYSLIITSKRMRKETFSFSLFRETAVVRLSDRTQER